MAELPYVINNGKIPEYFEKIQSVGVPDKATIAWLKSIGFTSSNDRYLAAFLKDIGFTDGSGVPSERWHNYRHSDIAKRVMAETIVQAYSNLFHTYPDAQDKDDEAIRNWMRGQAPKASPTTIDRALGSFKGICKLADFGALDDPVPGSAAAVTAPSTAMAPTPTPSQVALPPLPATGGPSVHINVELHLPASASADDYEAFFAAMRKHLFDGSSSGS